MLADSLHEGTDQRAQILTHWIRATRVSAVVGERHNCRRSSGVKQVRNNRRTTNDCRWRGIAARTVPFRDGAVVATFYAKCCKTQSVLWPQRFYGDTAFARELSKVPFVRFCSVLAATDF